MEGIGRGKYYNLAVLEGSYHNVHSSFTNQLCKSQYLYFPKNDPHLSSQELTYPKIFLAIETFITKVWLCPYLSSFVQRYSDSRIMLISNSNSINF